MKQWSDSDYKKFKEFVESHHDIELENKIDDLDIEIYYEEDEYGFQKDNENDFELSYDFSKNDELQNYGHAKELKYLFENDFKFIILNKFKSKLYKRLENDCGKWGKHSCVRSPETNIATGDRATLALFIENNKYLYAYIGSCYKPNGENIYYYDYVGEIK